jgi:site-specific DNA-methyltransferase (adenine-specific)
MKDEDWFSNDAMTTWGLQWFLRSLLVELRDVVTLGAHLYFFTDWRMSPVVYGVMEAHGFRVNHCLVWEKTHFGMGSYWRNQHENIVFASLGKPEAMRDRGRGSVLRFKNVSPKAREHPTQKPTELLSSILSAVPEGSVLDPYTGSGSTLVAAKMEGRKAIGVELDERYCEIAANRLRELDKG